MTNLIVLLFSKLTSDKKAIKKGVETKRCQIVATQLSTMSVVLMKSQTVSKSASADTAKFLHNGGMVLSIGTDLVLLSPLNFIRM